MDNDEFVPMKQYRYVLGAQFALIQQLVLMIGAIKNVLLERGIVTPELWSKFLNEAEMDRQAQDLREMVAKLQGTESLDTVLKDFEGSVQ